MPRYSKLLVIAIALVFAAATAHAEDRWSFKTSLGHEVSDASQKAKVKAATADLFEFDGDGIKLRLHPRFRGDADETSEFRRRNTAIWLPLPIDGKKVRAGCDPADEPVGEMVRTELSDERVSARFKLILVTCRDYYTSEPIEFDGLPFTVEGEFSVARQER